MLAMLTYKPDNLGSQFKQFIDFVQLMHILLKSAPHLTAMGKRQLGLVSFASISTIDLMRSAFRGLPCIGPVSGLSKFLMVSYGQPAAMFAVWAIVTSCVAVLYRRQRKKFPKRPFYAA